MTFRQDWIERCAATLKGKPFDADAALQGRIEGHRAFRVKHAPWKILQRVDHADDLVKARAQADEDLANGADGLVMSSVDVLQTFTHLPLHRIIVRNEGDNSGAEGLRALVSGLPLDPARLNFDFGLHDVDLAKAIVADGFVSPVMKADGRVGHANGLSHAGELGSALAVALGRWRAMDFLDDARLATSVSLTLAATQDMFGTLAKFRAARILWKELLAAAGLPDAPLALHGETSRMMLAELDPHTNILRAVTAVFGAGLGGADTICVLPFSFMQGLPNSFARRVARNVQLLLLHESHLWRVDDAAAGAGAIERRTAFMCDEAWAVMQACERGEWPVGDRSASPAIPVIGVARFENVVEPAPEIEGAS